MFTKAIKPTRFQAPTKNLEKNTFSKETKSLSDRETDLKIVESTKTKDIYKPGT
jgi:hypothetical protein